MKPKDGLASIMSNKFSCLIGVFRNDPIRVLVLLIVAVRSYQHIDRTLYLGYPYIGQYAGYPG